MPGGVRDGPTARSSRLLLEHARQAVVAGPPRRGSARPRPALRDGRLASSPRSAGGRRRPSRTAWPQTVDWYRRQRGRGGGRPARATGTPTTSASTGRASAARPRRCAASRVTGATSRSRGAGLGRSSARSPMRRSPARAGRSPGAGTSCDLDAPEGVAAAPGPRPARGRGPRGGLDRRRRLRARPGPRARPERDRDRRPRRGLRGARDRPRAGVSTNEVFDGTRTDGVGYGPDDEPAPGNPYGASKLAGERRRDRAPMPAPSRARRLGIARTAWLFGPPGRDFPSRILDAAERARLPPESRSASSPTSGARPTYTRRCRRRDRRAPGRGRARRHPPPRQRAVRDARRCGRATSSAGSGSTVEVERRPGHHLGTRRRVPPRWGVLAADPAAVRRAAPAVAGRDGRLRARAPAGAAAGARAAMSLERPSSSLPGVRYGAVARHGRCARLVPRAVAGRRVRGDRAGRRGRGPVVRPTFVQANLSTSAPGVLRGLHYHRRQHDYWVVASGRAFVALVDVRPILARDGRPAGRRDPRAPRRTSGS